MASRGTVLVLAAIGLTMWASGALSSVAVGGKSQQPAPHSEPVHVTRSAEARNEPGRRNRSVFGYRYVFGSSGNVKLAAASGWNLMDVDSKRDADRLPAGTRGLVWLGDYDNAACSFSVSDASLVQSVSAMAHDPRVAGYFFSDEPDPSACPRAPAEHRARSRLIHKVSPGKLAVMVADSNSGQESLRQISLWVGAADYIGLNPYVCLRGKPCDFGWIDTIIQAADKAGLPYWGAVQAFADTEWRWPTRAEEQRMLRSWARSKAAGYMVFAWSWSGHDLRSRPDLLSVLSAFNGIPLGNSTTAGAKPKPAARRPAGTVGGAQQVHYTFTGPSSVAFSWKGSATTIRFGVTKRYSSRVKAYPAAPAPISSRGPFWEARLGGLKPSMRYHYSIGAGPDRTFTTAPRGSFRFDVEADVGDSDHYAATGATQRQIAIDKPAFVLVAGDLTYGNDNGQGSVDRHFDDVMAWSREAAYMPAWGNHEWDKSTDDLRNYKGRFVIPHGQASQGAPSQGCCGEDWGWFDAGGVRFISYPEPYDDATWLEWKAKVAPVFASAQASPTINFIVTFGHRPAYSTGYHDGSPELAEILGSFGNRFSKYVVNFNGHSHNYERFRPIDNVTHITAAGGGSSLELPWSGTDDRTAYRAMHLEHVRVDVTRDTLRIQAICGPSSSHERSACAVGAVIDSVTIARPA